MEQPYQETSMAAVFQNRVHRLGERPCASHKKDGRYVDISWNTMNRMVRDLGCYLLSKGIEPGDRVAIFSQNRFEWWVADLAILSIGATDVPIYATNSAEETLYVLRHSGSKACFAGTIEHLEKVLTIKAQVPELKNIVSFDSHSRKDPDVTTLPRALAKGCTRDAESELESRIRAIKPSDPATIIYTSGTTGPPKGVALSHQNFLSNVKQCIGIFGMHLSQEDVLLSFLPLSHSLERTCGYYVPLWFGGRVAFSEDFSKVQQNLLEVRPSMIISVPRLYEKIHAGILAKVAEAPGIKRALFRWAENLANQNLPFACTGRPRKGWFALKYKVADRLVYSKLKAALGMDRIKFAVSGGGPLAVADAEFFLGMGITILEGYGLTETTPVTNANRVGLIKPGTVGPAAPDTTITLSDEGEILVKGPQVMLGYYKDEEATREVITEDGYFRTGDIGSIDEDGYLTITGRIKEIIITSGGKNISPQNIENALKESRFIEQVAVIGDRRKFLSALIVPAFEELAAWAAEKGVQYASHEQLVGHTAVTELFTSEVARYSEQFARVEQVRKFKLLPAEWTQQTGELTPTLKIKRRVVEEKYTDVIEEMYA